MHFITAHKWLVSFGVFLILLAGLILWQIMYIRMHHGAPVLAPTIPRDTEQFGSGVSKLNYVVMGDSTAIGQGADYSHGIARHTAMVLAATHRSVALTNVGVSGARVADVLHTQVAKAIALRPDVILLAIGANDVTHLTSQSSIERNLSSILSKLKSANPRLQVVLTGSPAMGSVPRFAKPTQWLARLEEHRVNHTIMLVAKAQDVIMVPLARATEATFLQHPEYFASDNFHPNASGYAVWFPVIDAGLGRIQS